MDEKLTDVEREFEEWWVDYYSDSGSPKEMVRSAYFAAYARATERTARRCFEICQRSTGPVPESLGADQCARVIAKEFGLD